MLMAPTAIAQRALAAALAVLATAGNALSAPDEPIGETLSVINVVTAEFNRDTRTLATGDDVRQHELIDVSADASTELKLNDDTKLALGPGAKLLLDKFVYDPDQSTGSIGVDLVQGAFRFMTGIAAKPSYVVRTPRASITVRGTIFDVYVELDQTTWLLLHEGAVRVCNERGVCRDHSDPGKLIRITPDGSVGAPSRWAGLEKDATIPFDTVFPFVATPPTIDPSPIFSRDDIVRTAAIEPEEKKPSKKRSKKASKSDDETKSKAKSTKKVTSTKKKKTVKSANKDDEDAKKALGLAIGVGVGLGLGKIGGGDKKHQPKGDNYR